MSNEFCKGQLAFVSKDILKEIHHVKSVISVAKPVLKGRNLIVLLATARISDLSRAINVYVKTVTMNQTLACAPAVSIIVLLVTITYHA